MHWNRLAEDLLGWNSQVLLGSPIGNLVPDSEEIFFQSVYDFLINTQQWLSSLRLRTAFGTILHVSAHAQLICSEKTVRGVVFFLDSE
jgi:PAS domain S-box-containing protein